MPTLPPFHGTMELRTVAGVTDYVQTGPGGVVLPPDGLAPGPGLLAPGATPGPGINGPMYGAPITLFGS